MATRKDFKLWIGNTNDPCFRLKHPVTGQDQDLTGYVFVMRAVAKGVEVYRQKASPVGATISFPWTTEQSRKLPEGKLTRYEVEARRVGYERTWIYGVIEGEGGINDDAA